MRSEQLPSFLDFEASSLDGYPIEVAISTADGEIRSWMIRPTWRWTDWSRKAEALHGISREMFAREGVPVRDVARDLNEALGDAVAYSDSPDYDGRVPGIARPATSRTSSNSTVWRPPPPGRF